MDAELFFMIRHNAFVAVLRSPNTFIFIFGATPSASLAAGEDQKNKLIFLVVAISGHVELLKKIFLFDHGWWTDGRQVM